jgi:hypothetical protein
MEKLWWCWRCTRKSHFLHFILAGHALKICFLRSMRKLARCSHVVWSWTPRTMRWISCSGKTRDPPFFLPQFVVLSNWKKWISSYLVKLSWASHWPVWCSDGSVLSGRRWNLRRRNDACGGRQITFFFAFWEMVTDALSGVVAACCC